MPSSPSLTALLAVVVVALVAGGAIVGYLYFRALPAGPTAPLAVALDDNVTVNYIGILGSGADIGHVFDTSIYSVATDSVSYPKSLEFQLRGSAANYTPLAVHVGTDTPSGGYSLGGQSFVQVVTGFWQGLVGLEGNQTRTLVLPPSLAYGPLNPACTVTKNLTYTLPMLVTVPLSNFVSTYGNVAAQTGTEFLDPLYGWPDYILSVNATSATVESLPSVGATAQPYGWTVIVRSVDPTANGTGAITLENELTPADSGLVLGHVVPGTGLCSGSSNGRFIVSAVDLGNGTFTENYNSEVQGQTLLFIVTVVDIYVPVATA